MQSFDNSYLLSDYAKKQLAKLDKNDPLVTPSKTPTPVNTGQQKRRFLILKSVKKDDRC